MDDRFVPHVIYAGCAVILYDQVLVPLTSVPSMEGIINTNFWYLWAFFVSGGIINRSINKIDKLHAATIFRQLFNF